MLDPFAVSALFVGTLQFVLQLKTYLHEKKKKRQEQDEQQQPQQHHTLYPHLSIPASPITYCICYHIYQAYPNHNVHYMQPTPYNYPLPLQPPNLYYHNLHTHSRSLAAADPSSSPTSLITYASTPSYDWLGLLGGHMELLHHQQAPHYTHETLGMRTGACAYNDRSSSYQHWKSLQEERCQGLQRSTIAVVDWSRGNIDMFMEIGGAYFRNYRVSGCDVAIFAYLFKEREVFSGEIKEQKLERFNKEMKMVENLGGVRSTNSWTSLGIYEESEEMKEVIREEASFIQTVRGAVFGLVCCLYEAPSDVNVDMEQRTPAHYINGHLDIVRVNTHRQPCHILKRHSCFFSVLSFADHGWAAQDILLG